MLQSIMALPFLQKILEFLQSSPGVVLPLWVHTDFVESVEICISEQVHKNIIAPDKAIRT
jgi:hypothetical protein